MSQQRRRRRRRRRGGSGASSEAKQAAQPQQQQQQQQQQSSDQPKSSRRRRRRGRPRGESRQATSPRSSEDLVRALPKERPKTLTAPPDGQTLDALIGELQSKYGVPQYPQEYRITIKVAEERDSRPETADESDKEPAPRADGVKREKAPAAPLLMRGEGDSSTTGRKRRRGRRRRRRPGGAAQS
ncbi:MAG TPA: hypothetical protein VFK89_06685 [Actinomycetota bacterium]|nr:hypothetical protein [Actinomycetota bacterium]